MTLGRDIQVGLEECQDPQCLRPCGMVVMEDLSLICMYTVYSAHLRAVFSSNLAKNKVQTHQRDQTEVLMLCNIHISHGGWNEGCGDEKFIETQGKCYDSDFVHLTFISTLLTLHFNLCAYISNSLGSLSASGSQTSSYSCIFSVFLTPRLGIIGPQCVH